MMKPTLLITSLAALLAAPVVQAELLAVEDFNAYLADKSLTEPTLFTATTPPKPRPGTQPVPPATTGLLDWVTPDTWVQYVDIKCRTGSLSYQNLKTTGKRLELTGDGANVWGVVNTAEGNPLAAYQTAAGTKIGTKDGTVLYMSFLYQLKNASTAVTSYRQNYIALSRSNSPIGPIPPTGPDKNVTTGGVNTGRHMGQAGTLLSDFSVNGMPCGPIDTNVHLFVLKIEYKAGDDSVTVWFDPDLSLPESEQGEFLVGTTSADFSFDVISMTPQEDTFFVDEIRFGTDFASVTPTLPEYTLTLGEAVNGTVEVTPAPGTSGKYLEGTKVSLAATVNSGYRFVEWTGVADADKAKNPVTVTVTADVTITPVFEAIPPVAVDIVLSDEAAGSVAMFPESPVLEGTEVEIEAFANEGYEFVEFSVGGTKYTANPLFLTINAATTVNANFQALSIFGSPKGDKLTTSLAWIDDSKYPYVWSYEFSNWLYVFPGSNLQTGAYYFEYRTGNWIWSSNAYGQWVYEYGPNVWKLYSNKVLK